MAIVLTIDRSHGESFLYALRISGQSTAFIGETNGTPNGGLSSLGASLKARLNLEKNPGFCIPSIITYYTYAKGAFLRM
jgi:hypothetical protein